MCVLVFFSLRVYVTHLLKLKSRRSKTSTGPVLLRIVRGWPANRQNTAPVNAVPTKLSSTPCTQTSSGKTQRLKTCLRESTKTAAHQIPARMRRSSVLSRSNLILNVLIQTNTDHSHNLKLLHLSVCHSYTVRKQSMEKTFMDYSFHPKT